ncbi:DNA mismatch repair protein MutS [Lactococcus lactis]|jgi:DNA mismatch repair protein MutS|uniref:DNA mismatch repair protein MutS n=1 Tax=Lactococcus TaxID=1357 RepID=UPI00288D27A6|nr:DNA mismatch repair protein MutS [Lactococcus lactis]MDT2871449.1 DNA mismatch repair protein MutS [Lactococcus lactis]MDT2876758.1 DNA mismatch repair protein MutS [Lactococcus lactis]MDT2893094.1 DNA mismatch repair protein MutS [Lactococcus lactis]MDT2895624.1 DNA mismatch repair protein MutS [Lactococcus lactis]MDT2914582.1 DNA mismatch repair protein MutS [Lactococcus lactis]
MAEKISPGMQQYLDIKQDYPDAFLLFRMGDFYELFYDDAVNAAQILELTLTSRNKNSENPIPMAGVPHHAAAEYIDKLVSLGYKVAVAEQMEDPKKAVGIVKRAVTQVITPGTTIDTANSVDNNFLVAIDFKDKHYALSYMDLSTGEFKVTELSEFSAVVGEIASLKAREIVAGFTLDESQLKVFERQMNLLISEQIEIPENLLIDLSGLTALENQVASKLLAYVKETQMRDLSHLQEVEHYEIKDFLQMDFATKSSLELTANKRENKKHGTLYWLLDETKTAMGTRMLRSWIDRPLVSNSAIQKRMEIVQIFLDHFFERSDLIEALKGVYDLERLASRVSFGKAVPVDFLQLANSLSNVPAIKNILGMLNEAPLEELKSQLDEIPELSGLINSAISENASRTITEGGIIKKGYNAQLDKYREALENGTSWIAKLEADEKAKTGISTLRIDYNRKDGYYFHITQSQLNSVPEHFYRKATLKNSERFGSQELTEIEEIMLEAREKSSSLEYDLFMSLRTETEQYIGRLQALAKTIAEIDCLQSLSFVAEKQGYIRPTLTDGSRIVEIKGGRHAVVEAVMGAQEYVPNDIELPEQTDIQLITGPNMSGKSTYMRQFALTVIMAQIGSFVPAETANLPIFDAIFTRIGASDNLISGESTFMVEMSEANHAIQKASSRSLIIFDELGRGTATYDGMALAQAIIEYVHDHIGAKTLFATHYHELTDLDEALDHLDNVHVATLEQNGNVTFLHKITEGPADKSYGIHVAKIAGLPQPLLERADLILQKLENKPLSAKKVADEQEQLSLFDFAENSSEIIEKIKRQNVDNMTAREALNFLWELKDSL